MCTSTSYQIPVKIIFLKKYFLAIFETLTYGAGTTHHVVFDKNLILPQSPLVYLVESLQILKTFWLISREPSKLQSKCNHRWKGHTKAVKTHISNYPETYSNMALFNFEILKCTFMVFNSNNFRH